MRKQRGNNHTTVQKSKQDPGSCSRNIRNSIFSSSAGTEDPTQVEDGSSRLSTRFLEPRPVTSPATSQKKVTHPAALTPSFAYKNFSPKTIREFEVFEHEPPILLAWPCSKPFSAPNSDILVCLASPVQRAHTLVFGDMLSWTHPPAPPFFHDCHTQHF